MHIQTVNGKANQISIEQQKMEKLVLEFHDKYTEIGVLQRGLPNKQGKKDYSEIESKVIMKARILKAEINMYLSTLRENDSSNKFIPQLDNLLYGLSQIEKDPYKRFSR